MTEVRWTPQAADDLQAIYDFILLDSPHYAQVIVEDIPNNFWIFTAAAFL